MRSYADMAPGPAESESVTVIGPHPDGLIWPRLVA